MQKIAGINGLEKEACRISDDENKERDCKNREMVKNFQRKYFLGGTPETAEKTAWIASDIKVQPKVRENEGIREV